MFQRGCSPKAQAVAASRVKNFDNERLLGSLRDFLKKYGGITARRVTADLDMPCVQSFHRFGGLAAAYRLIGYKTKDNFDFIERERGVQSIADNFTATITSRLREMGLAVTHGHRSKLLTLNGPPTVRLCSPLPFFRSIARLAASCSFANYPGRDDLGMLRRWQ